MLMAMSVNVSAIGSKRMSKQLRDDYRFCRKIMQQASRNYTFASLFLPRSVRRHVEALYGLMRVGDDRVDVSHAGFDTPSLAIDDWEREYYRAFETGDSVYPVMRAYVDTAKRFAIPVDTMAPYFQAMRDDLTVTRFETFDDLVRYMHGSAVPVGRGMTYILDVMEPHSFEDALPMADSLAIAMQLTNFWRDIREDWERGRVYIPREDLLRFGYSENDIAEHRVNDAFAELLEFEFARTEQYYRQAREGVAMLLRGRLGVLGALRIYHAVLDEIRRRHYDVYSGRAGAGLLKRTAIIAQTWWSKSDSHKGF
jgi:phytoene synthase